MPYVSKDDPHSYVGKQSVGSGECVPLVEQATGAPLARNWHKGTIVKGNIAIAPGTAIATFNEQGKYANNASGNHAAIYLGQDASGVRVVDQWNIRDKQGRIVRRQLPHERLIPFDDKKPSVNNGNSFSVVE